MGKERCLPVLNSTGVDRGLTLPPDLTAVPIVNLHMYNVFAAEGVNEKPRSGITAWPKFAARDRSASLGSGSLPDRGSVITRGAVRIGR